MKPEYHLFKKLKFGESGLGWNENTKTIEETPIWWLHKLQYYDTFFGDVVATGQRARTSNTYSAVNLEVGEEFTKIIGEEDDGKEGSDDSDDNNIENSPNLFPSSSLKSSKSSGSKRKKSRAEFVREGLSDLAVAFSSRSTQSTAAFDDAAINATIDILDNIEQVPSCSEKISS